MPATIQAVRTLDCANKVRIHYLLPQPFTTELLERFPDAVIDVQAFSQRVAGAKDHVTLTIGDRARATAVMGEAKLVVTYVKTDEQTTTDDIRTFEVQLIGADNIRIEYHPAPPAEWPPAAGSAQARCTEDP